MSAGVDHAEVNAAAARLFQCLASSAAAPATERDRSRVVGATTVGPCALDDVGSVRDHRGWPGAADLTNTALKWATAVHLFDGAGLLAPAGTLRRQEAARARRAYEALADAGETRISGPARRPLASDPADAEEGAPSADPDEDGILARELRESLRLKREKKGFVSRLGEARSALKDRDWKTTNIMCAVNVDGLQLMKKTASAFQDNDPRRTSNTKRDAWTQTGPAVESSETWQTARAGGGKQPVETTNNYVLSHGSDQLSGAPGTLPSHDRWAYTQWTPANKGRVRPEPASSLQASTAIRRFNGIFGNGAYQGTSVGRKRAKQVESPSPDETLSTPRPDRMGDSFVTAKQQLAKDTILGNLCRRQCQESNLENLDQAAISQYRDSGLLPSGKRRLLGKFVSPGLVQKEVSDEAETSGETPPTGLPRARGGLTKRSRSDFTCPLTKQREKNRQAADGGATVGSKEPEIADERLRNVEPAMVEKIKNEIMHPGIHVSWDDIAGLQEAKGTIKEIVVWPLLRPDIFTGLRGPPKGLLLFGPPGTGKTLIGKCIASQSNATFFSISSSSLTSKWLGDAEKMVRALFSVARCHQPAVIFVDEIDSLLSSRTEGEVEASRRIKTEFLIQFDGCGTTTEEDRILVVGATNRPQEIDEAARRRFRKRIYIPLPEASGRWGIIRNLLAKQQHSMTDEEIDDIVQKTAGYSGSDVDGLCREAALGPIRCIGDIRNISVDEVRPVNYGDFISALKQIRASVSDKDLELYRSWNREYGSGTSS